ncbi:hypothetical protein Purlil1_12861 [Purpureocillium lilacinum]|uniref:Uncharacterized protein n=1 Tax=Purpureocillium lilacinum TaxID=33203 RepID=A0ABR0BFX6_PURLI|nr:hypothetical protein Purlil1_12861 [Purpureocillium lilacinum]
MATPNFTLTGQEKKLFIYIDNSNLWPVDSARLMNLQLRGVSRVDAELGATYCRGGTGDDESERHVTPAYEPLGGSSTMGTRSAGPWAPPTGWVPPDGGPAETRCRGGTLRVTRAGRIHGERPHAKYQEHQREHGRDVSLMLDHGRGLGNRSTDTGRGWHAPWLWTPSDKPDPGGSFGVSGTQIGPREKALLGADSAEAEIPVTLALRDGAATIPCRYHDALGAYRPLGL